jgi:hypothetical protein
MDAARNMLLTAVASGLAPDVLSRRHALYLWLAWTSELIGTGGRKLCPATASMRPLLPCLPRHLGRPGLPRRIGFAHQRPRLPAVTPRPELQTQRRRKRQRRPARASRSRSTVGTAELRLVAITLSSNRRHLRSRLQDVTEQRTQRRVDFFVSYNHADEAWAEWVAWVLEEAGYTTRVQVWDFRPGSNFVLEMHRAAQMSERTIAILSPNYLGSHFTKPEWAAAFAHDPEGVGKELIPVRVAPSDADGLLGQIVRIDVVGLNREDAKAALLAGLSPGRAKPVIEPTFPGAPTTSTTTFSRPPTMQQLSPDLIWQPLTERPAVSWRGDLVGRYMQSTAALVELHLVPVAPLNIEVRRLSTVGDELAAVGRSAGLFSSGQALTVDANDQRAYAIAQPARQVDESGLAVTRTGQRSVWHALPHDNMGAVFDPDDLRPRLTALLGLLRSISLPDPERIAFALRIEPLMLLSFASASTVGHRSQAQMPFASRNSCSVDHTDALDTTALDANLADAAEELTARMAAALKSR